MQEDFETELLQHWGQRIKEDSRKVLVPAGSPEEDWQSQKWPLSAQLEVGIHSAEQW